MKSYPLVSLTVQEATRLQFKIVDAATRHLSGFESLSLGGLGMPLGIGKPEQTQKVEAIFAEVFEAEAALFVRGAGTGALRWSLASVLCPGDTLLVHAAPIYPTTKTTLEQLGVQTVAVDFNHLDAVCCILKKTPQVKAVLIQHTRQALEDRYSLGELVRATKQCYPALPVITDDNYAALKVPGIGCAYGADIATFSCFKTLGPEGVGVILGSKDAVARVASLQYSGGSQVQGHEAMAALRGIIYAPLALATSAQVCEELLECLNRGAIPEVKQAYLVNAQSKVVLVEFYEPCAAQVLRFAPKYGAAPHPVGCESRYEFAPLFYRISGTFRSQDATLEKRMIRINPLRAGSETVLQILRAALDERKKTPHALKAAY